MAACRDDSPPSPYSPGRLRLLLRLYPHMHPGDRHLPLPPELEGVAQSAGYRAWPSDAECEYLDLKRALAWLAERDERAELTVRLTLGVGMGVRDVADAFRARGLPVSPSTVWRWRHDGLALMAWYLGWRDPAGQLHPFEGEE